MAYAAQLNNILTKTKEIIKETDDGWNFFSLNNDVLCERKTYPNSVIDCFRATCLLDKFSAQEYAKCIWEITLADLQVIDSSITDVQTSAEIDEHTRIRYQNNKLPWPIWPRQTLFVDHYESDVDGIFILGGSVSHPSKPEDPSNFVRTTLHLSAYAFLPEGNAVRLWRIVHVDPNGDIPAFVVNANADSVAAACRYLLAKDSIRT
eukprot:TRINITY_DN4298_c0_g1_i1.p1 TRINITY_DN4298_c0_g1~~TRINITY_DN4298_c0_g1_i1.p1  ORF type:complete len:206 (-),score=21.20 TRINITY_DN4298_c0_g1_i1:176-793(-)